MQFPPGKTVIGRITNAAVDTATAVAFKDIDGVAYTFAEGERLIIYNITANNRVTAKALTIFQDHSGNDGYDAGEEIEVFSFAAAGTIQTQYGEGLPARKINAAGTNDFFAVASGIGEVDVLILGEVIQE